MVENAAAEISLLRHNFRQSGDADVFAMSITVGTNLTNIRCLSETLTIKSNFFLGYIYNVPFCNSHAKLNLKWKAPCCKLFASHYFYKFIQCTSLEIFSTAVLNVCEAITNWSHSDMAPRIQLPVNGTAITKFDEHIAWLQSENKSNTDLRF
jgi:hypothetical protein